MQNLKDMPENSNNTQLRPNTVQILRHLEIFRKKVWGNKQQNQTQSIEQVPQQTTIVESVPIVTTTKQKSEDKIKTNRNGDVRFHPYGINIGRIEWTQNGGNI